MEKFLLTAAFAVLFAAPSFAEDAASAPAADAAAVAAPAGEPVADATKEACTSETNEKVKLPENAGDAEKAQWDAAFAECVKTKSAPAAGDAAAAPATDGEAAADTAAPEAPAAE
jgi:hypothetical protein